MNATILDLDHNLQLIPIQIQDHVKIRQLMSKVYPPPYEHIWKDDGSWYIEMVYNKVNFENEITAANCPYYFVRYTQRDIGVLRVCFGEKLIDFPEKKATKLHRIYLDISAHGKGLGKRILGWVVQQARQRGDEILWLEAMDTQQQALKFYESFGFEICGSMRLDFDIMLPEYRGMHRMVKNL